jgi:hypothetical protein
MGWEWTAVLSELIHMELYIILLGEELSTDNLVMCVVMKIVWG